VEGDRRIRRTIESGSTALRLQTSYAVTMAGSGYAAVRRGQVMGQFGVVVGAQIG
jgi:hypothetical protein